MDFHFQFTTKPTKTGQGAYAPLLNFKLELIKPTCELYRRIHLHIYPLPSAANWVNELIEISRQLISL